MTQSHGDPRVYFAAERTLLAWVRTGLAFMGFGFVLARYRMLVTSPDGHAALSLVLGTALVVLGIFTTITSLVQFRRFIRTLPAADVPEGHSPLPSILSSAGLVVFGLLLALYLVVTAPELTASPP